jgi:purine nucleosidase
MRRFLIDTDTASDDAVALVMALQNPDISIEAITVVAGNVPVEQGLQNALYTVELCKKQVPVYAGMAGPMLHPLETAQHIHGVDGLGDIGLPLHGRIPAPGHAVHALIDIIKRFPGEITLVALGPLTNIALALRFDASIAQKVKECIIMGGVGKGIGNVTPVAEYNIWVDPEAAKIVFESGMPITMVGWDVCVNKATISLDEAQSIRQIGTTLAEFCIDIQHVHGGGKLNARPFVIADPLAMAIALNREVATDVRTLSVSIETESRLCRGQTVVDHLGVLKKEANVDVVMGASHEAFLHMLHEAVRYQAR